MRCPVCGVPTEVKETRGIRRRRLCFNNHLFTTTEQVVAPKQRDKAGALAALASGSSPAKVAKVFDLSPRTVRRWKNQITD